MYLIRVIKNTVNEYIYTHTLLLPNGFTKLSTVKSPIYAGKRLFKKKKNQSDTAAELAEAENP